ncbi:MAG: anthranilate synthase component I family protein [Phycisphaerae bacterium]
MIVRRIETLYPSDAPAVVAALPASEPLVWLDSSNADAAFGLPGRYSLIGWEPAALLSQNAGGVATMVTRGGATGTAATAWELVRMATRAGGPVSKRSFLDHMISEKKDRSETGPSARASFDDAGERDVQHAPTPGLVGYFGYELGEQLERLPAARNDDLNMPRLWLALLDHCIVLDHRERRAWVASCDLPHVAPPRDSARTEQTWRAAVERGGAASAAPPPRPLVHVEHEQSPDEYAVRVHRALAYIAAGDIYQVNLCQRLMIRGITDVLAAYDRLRRVNPAPLAALLRFGDRAVISTSPELFVQLRGREVLTSPIKGTRPRTGDAAHDERARLDLLASHKDAAELAMVVDLHRNDLGRVCEVGSVQVRSARRLETHPRVFHTVADVVGRLRPDRDAIDLLAATFPAGSVTGVPKIRAQQIIRELEPTARGVFSGAIGHIGVDGSVTMNVAIRTLQIAGDRAVLHVGGGIVADSDPLEEYRETLAKARGILEALGCEARKPAGA